MAGLLRFGNRGRSSRLDPRRRIEGGDIFQRRALERALTAVEKGMEISKLDLGTLNRSGAFAGKDIRQELSERLMRSGRNAPSLRVLNTPERRQALFGANTAVAFNKPFSSFQRKQLGFTQEQDSDVRSVLRSLRQQRGLLLRKLESEE